jgi:hypothetical protein
MAEKMTAEEAEVFIRALAEADRSWLREHGWTQSHGELLRAGRQTDHYCETPGLEVGHGAIWRCDCGQRWKLRLYEDTKYHKVGKWHRRRWWGWEL